MVGTLWVVLPRSAAVFVLPALQSPWAGQAGTCGLKSILVTSRT